jgi:hypothetical protein
VVDPLLAATGAKQPLDDTSLRERPVELGLLLRPTARWIERSVARRGKTGAAAKRQTSTGGAVDPPSAPRSPFIRHRDMFM